MKSSLPTPDHRWEVRFSSNGSRYTAKFSEISGKKRKPLNLNKLEVNDGDVIQLNSVGHDLCVSGMDS